MVSRTMAALTFCVVGFLPESLLGFDHPLHASRATVEFNSDTVSWEVSLCVFPDDFAEALSQKYQKKVEVPATDADDFDRMAQEFVAEHFQLSVDDGSPVKLNWVGHEFQTQQCWLYFEFPLVHESFSSVKIRNSILTDQFEDQLNVVYTRIGERQRTMSFGRELPTWHSWNLKRRKNPPAETAAERS